jgi:DNA topoisomerase IB
MDRGSLRIGSEQYAEENETYGLATLLTRHVDVDGSKIELHFTGKGGVEHLKVVSDRRAAAAIRELLHRRRGSELLAFKESGRWHELGSDRINQYVKDQVGNEFSAKDFRTWNATVMAAVALAGQRRNGRGGKRAIRGAIDIVARQLGNTAAVCRDAYVDDRVIDRFLAGETIDPGAGLPVIDESGVVAPRLGPATEAATLEALGA